jgi:hypothetical protein
MTIFVLFFAATSHRESSCQTLKILSGKGFGFQSGAEAIAPRSNPAYGFVNEP